MAVHFILPLTMHKNSSYSNSSSKFRLAIPLEMQFWGVNNILQAFHFLSSTDHLLFLLVLTVLVAIIEISLCIFNLSYSPSSKVFKYSTKSTASFYNMLRFTICPSFMFFIIYFISMYAIKLTLKKYSQ